MSFILRYLYRKWKGIAHITKPITKPNVGDIPVMNPAYTGMSNPINKYSKGIMILSTNESVIPKMMKRVNSWRETLIFSPKGIENIPVTHNRARRMPSLVIL